MIQPPGGYKPVQYSQEVKDLQRRVDETQVEIDQLPQEAVKLSATIETSHRNEIRSHLLACAAGAVGVAGMFALAATPIGWIVGGLGALGVISAELKAANHHDQCAKASSDKDFLPVRKLQLEEHRDFVAQWESDRRHTEWHEVNGY